MKLISSILICLLILSCSTTNHFKSVKYRFSDTRPTVVSGKIPVKWIDDKRIIRGSDYSVSEYLYYYADSSMIYVYNNYRHISFPNYDNIESLNSIESSLRLQDDYLIAETNKILIENKKTPLPRAPYNMIFEGVNNDGLFWKDIKYGDISIGYIGVSKDNKEFFDNALESFKVK